MGRRSVDKVTVLNNMQPTNTAWNGVRPIIRTEGIYRTQQNKGDRKEFVFQDALCSVPKLKVAPERKQNSVKLQMGRKGTETCNLQPDTTSVFGSPTHSGPFFFPGTSTYCHCGGGKWVTEPPARCGRRQKLLPHQGIQQ